MNDSLRNEVDALYASHMVESKTPGIVYGVLLDGQLIHAKALGFADLESKRPVSLDTRFRVASMTKSFTALAILKLRDEGKIDLHSPVVTYLPAASGIKQLTKDAPQLTVYHLLSQCGGLPQDDPWGDRLLDMNDADFNELLKGGITQSSSTGSSFEYSNLGYAMLGAIITAVSGMPFSQYIRQEILVPLDMLDTTFEIDEVPHNKLAIGYRHEDGVWKREEMLHDGAFGPMGGLITTLNDFAKYVSFHQGAWPPGNDDDYHFQCTGIKRSTVREMHMPRSVDSVVMPGVPSQRQQPHPHPFVTCYAYGLRYNKDSKGNVWVRHAGGLPGFGSDYRFFLTNRLALIAFGNKTYSPQYIANTAVGACLLEGEDSANLRKSAAVHIPVSDILEQRVNDVKNMILESSGIQRKCIGNEGCKPSKITISNDAAVTTTTANQKNFASNFFKDKSSHHWDVDIHKIVHQQLGGDIVAETVVSAINNLRGTFFIRGKNGNVARVFLTLTPEAVPRIQDLSISVLKTDDSSSIQQQLPKDLEWVLTKY